jgi:hypothetical protein
MIPVEYLKSDAAMRQRVAFIDIQSCSRLEEQENITNALIYVQRYRDRLSV